MTRFQKYRAEAFDKLVDKFHREGLSMGAKIPLDEIRKRAEFCARMRLAKEAKRSNQQTSMQFFDSLSRKEKDRVIEAEAFIDCCRDGGIDPVTLQPLSE